VHDLAHVLEIEDLRVREDLLVEVQPVGLGDCQTKHLRGKSTSLVKVIWDKRTGDFTWELEGDMMKSYPHLFSSKSQFSKSKNFIVEENVRPFSFSHLPKLTEPVFLLNHYHFSISSPCFLTSPLKRA